VPAEVLLSAMSTFTDQVITAMRDVFASQESLHNKPDALFILAERPQFDLGEQLKELRKKRSTKLSLTYC